MSLTLVHDRLSITIILYLIILFIWGIWVYFRKSKLDENYMGALVIVELIILIQGIIGIILYFRGMAPAQGSVHILYGIVGALGIPAVYIFTKGRDDRRIILIYLALCLFNIGIFMRSIFTG